MGFGVGTGVGRRVGRGVGAGVGALVGLRLQTGSVVPSTGKQARLPQQSLSSTQKPPVRHKGACSEIPVVLTILFGVAQPRSQSSIFPWELELIKAALTSSTPRLGSAGNFKKPESCEFQS